MSLSQYKSIDLLLFTILAVIFEVINKFAYARLSSFQLIFMSFTIVLAIIAMYRWGISGIIVVIFGKLIAVVISTHNNDYKYYLSYIFGTLLGVLLGYLLFQKLIGKKRIKKIYLIIPYLFFDFIFTIIFMSLIVSLAIGSNFSTNFVNNLKSLLVQESMSIFTSTIILLVANRKNGNILVEIKSYIKDVQDAKKLGGLKEMQESPKFNSDKPFTEYDQIDNSNILDGGTMNIDQLKELEKMFENCDKIKIDNPIDCLAEQEKKDKNV